MTPDWAARPTTVPYAVFGDPQSLNLYGYVRNDPLSRIDPDGHNDQNAPPCDANINCAMKYDMAQGTTQEHAQNNNGDNQSVGNTTVGSLEKTMSNEDRSLSTPKKGDPGELENGKEA